MNKLPIPKPFSAGLFLSYRCNSTCRHCMYACSPRWSSDWISVEDAEIVLAQLAAAMEGRYAYRGQVSLNEGLHFTGGEPFLNYDLLLQLAEAASGLGIASNFIETNGFWCRDDATTRQKLQALKQAGLDGIMVSANPFILEQIPFERTRRAVRISREIFGPNAFVYQRYFYDQFQHMGLKGTLSFDSYLQLAGYGLQHAELLANGRVPYKLGELFERYPASHFFGLSCQHDMLREWHVHVDNYCNFLPGFCGGLSLGDARELDTLYGRRSGDGIDLDTRPVLKALFTDLADLLHLGLDYGFEEQEGYVSKCHLCADVRRHLARHGEFSELRPTAFYERLEDGPQGLENRRQEP